MTSPCPPAHAASAAIFALIFAATAQAVPIVPGFVKESRGKFEYNTGRIDADSEVYAAFTYFGEYPGHFDILYASYTPDAFWGNDSELAIETYHTANFYWSGDHITGTGQYYTYGQLHRRLRITATYQDVVEGSHIGNVNIKGLYVPDSGSTLLLLGGTLVAGAAARAFGRRKA